MTQKGADVGGKLKQKVVVVGYYGEEKEKGKAFSVRETVNFVDLMPGEKVSRGDLEKLIADGVEVIARRRS